MPKLSARLKLILLIAGFVVFTMLMFLYGYGIMERRNQSLLDNTLQKRLELEVLKREQKNFEQGKKDIATLDQKEYPPQDLFSKDTKVVKEIQKLEALAANYNLKISLSVSGTSKTAKKATGVSGDLLLVPYIVSLEGSYTNIVRYVQSAEHTSFINKTQAVRLAALQNGNVKATLNSEFYLKQ